MIFPEANCLRPSRTGGNSFTHGGSGIACLEEEDEDGEEKSDAGCAMDGCLVLRQAVYRSKKSGLRKG